VTIAYLGLGSNLGDRWGKLAAAVAALRSHPVIQLDAQGFSASLFETAPVDVADRQPMFWNTAIRITSDFSPQQLLQRIQEIENRLGRVRQAKNEARTIDIDLLMVGDQVIQSPELVLPHPRMHVRRFVMEPLAELAPSLLHPTLKLTATAIAESLRQEATHQIVQRIAGRQWWMPNHRHALSSTLVQE